LGMAILIFVMGSMRLMDPMHLSTGPMLAVAAGGLATEVISIALLYQGQKTNLNVKGAFWHVLQTFVGSLIIVVAALVIRFTDFLEIDPLLGMTFAVLLLWASWTIVRSALHILMDNVPGDLDMHHVKEAIEGLSGVRSVHHLHAWSLTSGKNILSVHVLVDDLGESEPTLQGIQSMLKRDFGIYFSTVQLETEVCEEIEAAEEIDYLRKTEAPAGGDH